MLLAVAVVEEGGAGARREGVRTRPSRAVTGTSLFGEEMTGTLEVRAVVVVVTLLLEDEDEEVEDGGRFSFSPPRCASFPGDPREAGRALLLLLLWKRLMPLRWRACICCCCCGICTGIVCCRPRLGRAKRFGEPDARTLKGSPAVPAVAAVVMKRFDDAEPLPGRVGDSGSSANAS